MNHANLSGSWKWVGTAFETAVTFRDTCGRVIQQAAACLPFVSDIKCRPLVAADGYVAKAPLSGEADGYRLLYAGSDRAAAEETAVRYNCLTRRSDLRASVRRTEAALNDEGFAINADGVLVRTVLKDREDSLLVFLGASGGGGRQGYVNVRRDASMVQIVALAEAAAPHGAACEAAVIFRPGDELVIEDQQSFDRTGDIRTKYEVYSYFGLAGINSGDHRDKLVRLEMVRMSADEFAEREARIARIKES